MLVYSPHRIGIAVGIAETQVNEFDIIANTRYQDIFGFKVQMYYLPLVKITYDTEELMYKVVGILAVTEIIGVKADELTECFTINIVHQDTIGSFSYISY